MYIDNALGNGQAETESAVAIGHALSTLFEGVENARLQFGINPDPGISEIDNDVVLGVVARADAELAAGRSKFDRILDDVPKDLLQSCGISPAMMFLGGEILLNLDLLFVQIAGRNSERVIERCVHIDGIVPQLEFAMGDAGEIEEVVDEESFELDVAPEHIQIPPRAIWNVMIALKRSNRHEHGRKRSAQFMGEHGEELVLGAVRLFRILFRFFECVLRLFAFCDFENRAEESRWPAGIVEENASLFLQPTFS